MAPVTAQAHNRASSLHKLNKQEMQNGKSPVSYVIAIQLHQIHQLAVKMNTKKMFKTLKTLGRKQSRNKYKLTTILCKQRICLRRDKVSKHLQKHPGLLINSELQIRYNLNSEQRGGLHCRPGETKPLPLPTLRYLHGGPTRKRPVCSNNITRQRVPSWPDKWVNWARSLRGPAWGSTSASSKLDWTWGHLRDWSPGTQRTQRRTGTFLHFPAGLWIQVLLSVQQALYPLGRFPSLTWLCRNYQTQVELCRKHRLVGAGRRGLGINVSMTLVPALRTAAVTKRPWWWVHECEYSKKHWIVFFKWVNYMAFELYLKLL